MSDSDQRLPPSVAVVFAKPAEPGHAMTRLADAIGDEPAAELYRAFLRDTARSVADLSVPGHSELGLVLALEGEASHASFDPFRDRGYRTIQQGEGDLGDRLARVTETCFERGAERVVAVGSDSPTLLARHLIDAYEHLRGNDVVLGPSFDGGYYLVGLRSPTPGIFQEIDWSTNRVLPQTLRRARNRALLCELIEFWYDVDTFEDLERLKFHLFEYLSRRDHSVAPETARVLRRLEDDGALGEDESPAES